MKSHRRSSPAWFLRSFRCGVPPICVEDADPLLDQAATPDRAQRAALFLARRADGRGAAVHPDRRADPLVAGRADCSGFAENPFARHTLSGLRHRDRRRIVDGQSRQNRRPYPGPGHRSAIGPPARRGDGEGARALFVIPGNKPVGLDVILDLVPVAARQRRRIGSYIAWEARNLGMSKWQLARMGGNIGVDLLLGLIPWIGAIPTSSSTPTPATCGSSSATSTSTTRTRRQSISRLIRFPAPPPFAARSPAPRRSGRPTWEA